MGKKLDFKPIKNKIQEPSKVIDALIDYLELIKKDLNEPHHDLEEVKASLNIRCISVQHLNKLLEKYLNQHELSIKNNSKKCKKSKKNKKCKK